METGKRLTRSTTDVMVGGVCAGLGKYFGIDPTLVRLFFVLLTLAGGSGVLVYIILWIIIPREDMPASQDGMDSAEFSKRAGLMGQEMGDMVKSPNARTVQFIGIALVVLGLIYLVQNLNIPWLHWLNSNLIWPLLLIVAGGLLLWRAFRK